MADYASGRVTIPVIPSVQGIHGTISRAFAGVRPTVTPEIDVTGLVRQVRQVSKEKLDLDASRLQAKVEAAREKLAELERLRVSPRVDAEITAATARLDQVRARLRELEGMDPSPRVTADIAQAQARIATINDQIERLNAQRASPRVDADIAAARAQIEDLNRQLRGVDEQRAVADVEVNDGGSTEQVGGRLDGLKDRVRGLGPAFAVAGAAAGAALIAGITEAIQVADARAVLGVQLGLTAQESERYGALAGQLYSGAYGASLDEVNTALAAVTRNIGGTAIATDESMTDATAGVLNLSSAFGVDLNEATRAVGTLMKNGLAPDAKSALDIITVGLQSGVNVADDLFDTFSEYSVQFRKLGLDGQVATGLLSQGLLAGARDADTVADALKEFSIRAIDGSTSAAAAYRGLGLDAEKLSAQIASGGPAAEAGLGTVLSKLREIKDPVLQAQLAVGLFGTKAEDLGASLYALDPSTAVASLGEVGGAADRMNTALGETSSARLESFTRSIKTGLVDFIGGAVLPALDSLSAAGASLFGEAWGPAKEFLAFMIGPAGAVAGVIIAIVAATWLWTAASTALAASWLANPITWIIIGIVAAVGILVAGVIWAWNNFEGFRNVVFGVWEWLKSATASVASFLATVWSGIVAGVQWVGGIFAAVWGGVVAAATWVGDAFTWLWSTILSPVFSAIWTAVKILAAIIFVVLVAPVILGVQLLGAIFTWLWANVVAPAFAGIAALAGWLWNSVLAPAWAGIQAGISWLGDAFLWLYTNAVKPTVDFVAAAALWLWNNALLPAFGGIQTAIGFLGSVFRWLYDVVVKPVFDLVGIGASFLWNSVLVPAFGGIQIAIQTLGSVFRWLYDVIVKPVFDAIGAAGNFVWNNVLRPAFDGIMGGVRAVGDAFGWAVDKIAEVWGRIMGIVRPPVEFVVNAVYSGGIRPAWNFIAGIFDLGQLPELRFATGGLVPGYAPGRDTVPAMLSPGEGVLVPEAVRMLGAENVLALNSVARRGRSRGVGPSLGGSGDDGYLPDHSGVQRFADGGIVGWLWDVVGNVGDFIGGAVDFISDPVGSVKKVFANIATDGLGGVGQLSEALFRFPTKVVDSAVEWLKGFLEKSAPSGAGIGAIGNAGAGVQQWSGVAATALAMMGQPAALLQVVLRRMNQESGGNAAIVNTWDSNWQKGTPSVGLMQVIGPTYRSNADPRRNVGPYVYGTSIDPLSNILASMRYAVGRYGSLAAAYNKAGGYDNGGWLPPGLSLTYNGTGRPEAVLTERQWSALDEARVSGGDGVFTGDLYLDSGEFLGAVRGVVRNETDSIGTALSRGRR